MPPPLPCRRSPLPPAPPCRPLPPCRRSQGAAGAATTTTPLGSTPLGSPWACPEPFSRLDMWLPPLMPQTNPGSRYRCGKSTVSHGWSKGALKSASKRRILASQPTPPSPALAVLGGEHLAALRSMVRELGAGVVRAALECIVTQTPGGSTRSASPPSFPPPCLSDSAEPCVHCSAFPPPAAPPPPRSRVAHLPGR